VVIPPIAATYSAFGMFAMDVGRNFARSYVARADEVDPARITQLYAEMEAEAADAFTSLGVSADGLRLVRTADMRYLGQFHEVEVPVPDGEIDTVQLAAALEAFHVRHHDLYTFNMPWQRVELLTFRVRATVPGAPLEMPRTAERGSDGAVAIKRHRDCWFDGQLRETPVYDGSKLRSGDTFHGPAIVEETTTTVVVPSSYALTVSPWRDYVLTRDGSASHAVEAAAQLVGAGSR
jgi:N-methylhydantoinase A